jgi:hypothetical protein
MTGMTLSQRTLGAALAFAALFAAVTAAAETPAQANAEAARKAWIKAKDDLQKASGAYDKATEAYIKTLAPAAKPKPTPTPIPSGPPQRLVVFTGPTQGLPAFMSLPINYQAQLTVDGKATGWNVVTNELTFRVAPLRSLAYEVRRVTPKGGLSGGGRPEYQYVGVCKGNLAPKDKTTVAIDMNSRCAVR